MDWAGHTTQRTDPWMNWIQQGSTRGSMDTNTNQRVLKDYNLPTFSMTVFSRGQNWGHEVVAEVVLVPRGARRDGRGGRRSLGAPHQRHRPRHGRWWRVHSRGVIGGRPARYRFTHREVHIHSVWGTSWDTRYLYFKWVLPARSWWLLILLADQCHKVIERLLRNTLVGISHQNCGWSRAYNDQLIRSLSECDGDIILKVSSSRLRDELWQCSERGWVRNNFQLKVGQ